MEIRLSITPPEYILAKGWQAKKSDGDHLAVSPCPKCGDEKFHFRINKASGLWDCKKCSSNGNLVSLLKDQGDLREYLVEDTEGKKKPKIASIPPEKIQEYHDALLASDAGMMYFRNRGFTLETIQAFKLGFKIHPSLGPMVGYPTFADRDWRLIKWRTITGKKTFRREPDGVDTPLFNQNVISKDSLYVCEGEADAIALLQAGFKNVIGTTNGAGSFLAPWVRMLKQCKRVYLCFDPDPVGVTGAEKVAARIGHHKTYKVELPEGLDVNDFLNIRGAEEFNKLIADAKPYGARMCLTAEDVYTMRITRLETGEGNEIVTGFGIWDRLVGPMRRGNTYVLAGYPGVGKTTMALNVAWSLSRKGIKCWYYCLELSAEEVMEAATEHVLSSADSARAARPLSDADWSLGYAMIQPSGLRFYDPKTPRGWQGHLEVIAETAREEGVDVLFIDNFFFLTRVERNQTEAEGVASRELKALSQSLNIPIVILHHLRKPDMDDREPEPNAQAIRGSGAILADASDALVLHHPLISGGEEGLRHPVGFLLSGKPRWGRGGRRYVRLLGGKRIYADSTVAEYKEQFPTGGARRKAFQE